MAVTDVELRLDTSRAKEEIRVLRAEVQSLRNELETVRSPRVSIGREPLTYDAQLVRDSRAHRGLRALQATKRSYVQDFILAERNGDRHARERLDRHSQEMRALTADRSFVPNATYEFEQRGVSWTTGTGGYFAPPLWIVEQFAIQPTPERVLSALAPTFDLPEGAQSVNLPRFVTGTGAPDVLTSSVGGATTGGDNTDSVVSSAVATISGNFDVPMQMLEQSPQGAHLDWVAFTTMEARYGGELEKQLINGYGSNVEATRTGNNQLLGILNNTSIPAANKVTYTDSTPTVAEFVNVQSSQSAGGAAPQMVAAIGNNRKVKPEAWMMTTSRAAWMTSGDLGMPLALANQIGPGSFDLLAYPVRQNDAIPVTLGATANQDTIVCCRPSDWLILESEPKTSIFGDALSGTLEVRLQYRRYVAALLRQPTSVSYVTGSGMVIQSGF